MTLSWRSFPGSRDWRRIYLAYVFSSLGNEFTRIALLVKIYELDGQVTGLAIVSIAQLAPSIVLSPLAGTLADAGYKRSLLVMSDLARLVLVILLLFSGSLAMVITLAGFIAGFTAIFEPVEAALEPEVLENSDIPKANVVRTGTSNVLNILGPALVAVVLVRFGLKAAFLFDAFTFFVSAMLLLSIRWTPLAAVGPASVRTNFKEGFRWIIRQPELRLLIIVNSILYFLFALQGPLLYAFAEQQLAKGGAAFATLMTALGVGALAGSALLYRYTSLQERRLELLMTVLLIDAAALFVFTFGRSLLFCCAFMIVMGLISSAFQIVMRTHLQTIPTPEYRARVFGTFAALRGPISIFSLTMVVPLSRLGLPGQILQGAAIAEASTAVAGLATLRWRHRRNNALRDEQASPNAPLGRDDL